MSIGPVPNRPRAGIEPGSPQSARCLLQPARPFLPGGIFDPPRRVPRSQIRPGTPCHFLEAATLGAVFAAGNGCDFLCQTTQIKCVPLHPLSLFHRIRYRTASSVLNRPESRIGRDSIPNECSRDDEGGTPDPSPTVDAIAFPCCRKPVKEASRLSNSR